MNANVSAKGWNVSANWKRSVSSAENGMNAIEGVEARMNANDAATNVRRFPTNVRIAHSKNGPHLLPLPTRRLLPLTLLLLLRSLTASLGSADIQMRTAVKGVRERREKRLRSKEAAMNGHDTMWTPRVAEAVSAEQNRVPKRPRSTLMRSTVDVSSKKPNGAAPVAIATVTLTGNGTAGDEERKGRSLASVQTITVPARLGLMLPNHRTHATTSALPAFWIGTLCRNPTL